MSLFTHAPSSGAYEEVVTVQPTSKEIKEATTFITYAVAADKLLNDPEQIKFNTSIKVSRRAIGYINSYDSETKKIITDMREFLQKILEGPKFKQSTKSKVVKEAEKVFLEEYEEKIKIPRSAPIQITQQKLNDEHPNFGSFTPRSGEFLLIAGSPPPPARKHPPIFSSMCCYSPKEENSVYAIFLTPSLPWGSTSPIQNLIMSNPVDQI